MRGMMSAIIRPRIRWPFLAGARHGSRGTVEVPGRITNPSVPCTTGTGGLEPGLGVQGKPGWRRGLTERSQFGVKWVGVRWLVTGHRRVRRPGRGWGRCGDWLQFDGE